MQEKLEIDNPFVLFRNWFEEARASGLDPTPMTLATVDEARHPKARVVLLKGYDARGFVFYTNMQSRKAIELEKHPYAALCFFWPGILKQVRIEGKVESVKDEEADRYFASRPRQRQLAAWASKQSEPLASREELLARYREFEEKYAGKPIPRPPFWSGYRVIPELFEFWIGHEDRLNERILFRKNGSGWEKMLLYP